MTPDPAIDWLARLTPNGSRLDPTEVLVRAGRASARTPWGWKLAVAALLLANVATVVILLPHREHPRSPEATPAPVVSPASAPTLAPPPESPPGSDANSIAALARSLDPDAPPPPAGFVAPDHPEPTLTVGSRGVTD